MKNRLHIAPELDLPLDAVTQTFGVLAVRGAGKSNLAAAMAEEMYTAKLPFVVIDPVGSWWGLRSAGDGKGAGLEIPIFGGRHADVPLERGAGVLIADLIVAQRMTCVLDVSELSEGDKIKFLIDFAERLYRKNTEPLHLFLEEADDYAPQRPFREQARLLGAWENIVRRGRARGLGITMISQRSASLNKNVLTQIETLFVLRTTSPQDRAAIEAWVKYQGGAVEMLKTLPELAAGEAWVWSPSWLQTFKRLNVRRRWTFDSGATPKEQKGKRAPATLADVDLGAIRESMAQTIERAKLEDPKALRAELARREARIGELQRELERARAATKTETKTIEVRQPIEDELDQLTEQGLKMGELLRVAQRLWLQVETAMKDARLANESAERLLRGESMITKPGYLPSPRSSTIVQPHPAQPRTSTNGHGTAGVSAYAMSLIEAMAQREPMRLTRLQISTLSGRSHRSSAFAPALREVQQRGLATLDGNGQYELTDEGRALVPTSKWTPKTGQQIQQQWLQALPAYERTLMEALIAEYPRAASRERLSELTGKSLTSSAFAPALSTLCKNGIATRLQDDFRASEDLFG